MSLQPPAEGSISVEQAQFDDEVATHDRAERRMLWKELGSIAFVAVVVVARYLWLT